MSLAGAPARGVSVGGYLAATCLAAVGVTLSGVGMVETATYALAIGGVLFCALAVAADVLTLTMPATVGALWRRRSPAVVLAGALWCAGSAVTIANLAGYVGEHVEQYQSGRETLATGRSMALERLARLKDERKAITETRPPAAIAATLNDARRSERPALREALAMAKRRDALDIELATFERQLGDIPQVATADASAAVLSAIGGTTVSEHELRRLRLALLLGLPLCGGLVLSLAFALTAAVSARRSTTV
jgi:DNA-binding transcriptional regulator YdaS (Cro superfamily)